MANATRDPVAYVWSCGSLADAVRKTVKLLSRRYSSGRINIRRKSIVSTFLPPQPCGTYLSNLLKSSVASLLRALDAKEHAALGTFHHCYVTESLWAGIRRILQSLS